MKVSSKLHDGRINAWNILLEIQIGEYEKLITGVLTNNVYQRKRVGSSKTVYSLLREDLKRGCIIPPVVLALTNSASEAFETEKGNLTDYINQNSDDLIILDGLQRTYTILDLLKELRRNNDERGLQEVESATIRIEIYIGINRLGILYRMLTLNTGQTPMSLRQQIEMLYLGYLDKEIEGIQLVRESDGTTANGPGKYNFKDVIDGFNAYLDRDELPIDKADILENINSLEKLSREDESSELFEQFVRIVNAFVERICDETISEQLTEEYLERDSAPFGKSSMQVFKKPQAMSGLGAALGKLIDFEIITGLEAILDVIPQVKPGSENYLEEINYSLAWLKSNAKKIGNAQRTFFSFYFRDLFNPDSDSYLNLQQASKTALRKYQAQNF